MNLVGALTQNLLPAGPHDAGVGQSFAEAVAALAGEAAPAASAAPAKLQPLLPPSPVTAARPPDGYGRAAQPETVDPRGQDAIQQVLGAPLSPGDATFQTLPTAQDVRKLDLGLSKETMNTLAEPGYAGRMVVSGDKSYAFAFADVCAESAKALGVPEDEYLRSVQVEEAGHATVLSRFPNLSNSENEVVGEAIAATYSPSVVAVDSMSDILNYESGALAERYGPSVALAEKAVVDTLGPGGDYESFMNKFALPYSNGVPVKKALDEAVAGYLKETGSSQSPEQFLAKLQQNMLSRYRMAAEEILREEKAGEQPAT